MTAKQRENSLPRLAEIRGQHEGGMTLIEVLIVVVIISIIASIAYPSYTDFIVRAKRSAAQSMLMQVTDRQAQYFMDHKRFAASLTSLGFASDPFTINDEGAPVADGSADSVYTISLTNATATAFTAAATPQLMQATRDTDCGTLTMTHAGQKGKSGSSDKCW